VDWLNIIFYGSFTIGFAIYNFKKANKWGIHFLAKVRRVMHLFHDRA
jgi:hypothetical protein